MGQNNTWLIIINILINVIMDYVESKQDYSCPHYCEVKHKHIGVEDNGLYNAVLGTTDSLHSACNNIDTDEDGHRCFEGQSEDSVYIVE